VRFASLGSGSKGNATLVATADTLLLIDCGFSVKETLRRLATLGLEPEQLDAILVTHEHSDHCSGVARLSRRFKIPVYLTYGTASSGRCEDCYQTHRFNAGDRFEIKDVEVLTVAVPHDAREPCQFRLAAGGQSLGVLTDLGSITSHVVDSYRECTGLLLEFNHDMDMLQRGSYPPQLKRRVGGDWGHLNNVQAAELLQQLSWAGMQHLVVAHISENNNCLDSARDAIVDVLGDTDCVTWANQANGFPWLQLG
jgi:phosphoribosyl 1,2-cyclic phosphodiesterase